MPNKNNPTQIKVHALNSVRQKIQPSDRLIGSTEHMAVLTRVIKQRYIVSGKKTYGLVKIEKTRKVGILQEAYKCTSTQNEFNPKEILWEIPSHPITTVPKA